MKKRALSALLCLALCQGFAACKTLVWRKRAAGQKAGSSEL